MSSETTSTVPHVWADGRWAGNLPIEEFLHLCIEEDLPVLACREVSTEDSAEKLIGEGADLIRFVSMMHRSQGLYRQDDCLIHFNQEDTSRTCMVWVAGFDEKATVELADDLIGRFSSIKPGVNTIVNFWALSDRGPVSRVRRLSSLEWDDIYHNYPARCQDGLKTIMDMRPPFQSGRLILWHGHPGGGKTTAIRALCRQWRDWCKVSYIVDPDEFFAKADYMLNVILHDDTHPSSADSDEPDWQLLVVEDADEFLRMDAKERKGQALSRLLNIADGMVGQGLNLLLLFTTNEPVGTLHPAVAREGRCMANLEFPDFTRDEAKAWLKTIDPGADWSLEGSSFTLSKLYDMARERQQLLLEPGTKAPGQYL